MTVKERWVVTVDRRGSRLAEFSAQPGGTAFAIFDGVDLRSRSEESVACLADQKILRHRYGRSLAPGEIGCAMSHRELMSVIATNPSLAEDDVILVVEDDAVLHPQLDALLPWLVAQPFDLMPLHHGSASRVGLPDPSGLALMDAVYPLSPLARQHPASPFRAGYTTPEAWMGTLGYLVRKRTARHLVAVEQGPVTRVADDYRVIADLGLRVCQVRPSLVWESSDQVSEITATGRESGSPLITEDDVIQRLRQQASSRSLRARKICWLLLRDAVSRWPWGVKHNPAAERIRRSWNDNVAEMPPRVRHLLRPGVP